MGQIPDDVVFNIGRQIVHRLAVGYADIEGNDFGTIFANALGGEHRSRPLGIADVIFNGCAWSAKTHKPSNRRLSSAKVARLISGRNSIDFSFGIDNPREDPEKTGHGVISIWNARVNDAFNEFDELRIVVMLRNMLTKDFCIFEEEARRYNPNDFEWRFNRPNNRGNLEGRDRLTGFHQFTWQPSGGQFTIRRPIPTSAKWFSINQNIPIVDPDSILAAIRFNSSWITIHGQS